MYSNLCLSPFLVVPVGFDRDSGEGVHYCLRATVVFGWVRSRRGPRPVSFHTVFLLGLLILCHRILLLNHTVGLVLYILLFDPVRAGRPCFWSSDTWLMVAFWRRVLGSEGLTFSVSPQLKWVCLVGVVGIVMPFGFLSSLLPSPILRSDMVDSFAFSVPQSNRELSLPLSFSRLALCFHPGLSLNVTWVDRYVSPTRFWVVATPNSKLIC